MHAIHPRLQRRREDTRRRRAAAVDTEYARARESLLSVARLLDQVRGRVPSSLMADLEATCDRLLGTVDRLRATGWDKAQRERLTSAMNRFSADLLALAAVLL
jgi:hypothetical protein